MANPKTVIRRAAGATLDTVTDVSAAITVNHVMLAVRGEGRFWLDHKPPQVRNPDAYIPFQLTIDQALKLYADLAVVVEHSKRKLGGEQ